MALYFTGRRPGFHPVKRGSIPRRVTFPECEVQTMWVVRGDDGEESDYIVTKHRKDLRKQDTDDGHWYWHYIDDGDYFCCERWEAITEIEIYPHEDPVEIEMFEMID